MAANGVFAMLDGRQREAALVDDDCRAENAIGFRGRGEEPPGHPGVGALGRPAGANWSGCSASCSSPTAPPTATRSRGCLAKQGGLDRCRLAFYREGDIGDDGVWDNWRLEGPAFVWHFRGAPHVHVWVNIADTPDRPTNA